MPKAADHSKSPDDASGPGAPHHVATPGSQNLNPDFRGAAGNLASQRLAGFPEQGKGGLASLTSNGSRQGRAVSGELRQEMDSLFRADFSSVRLHLDAKSSNMASQIKARAFTLGQDIYFGQGQFEPDTPDGRELLAHELTHTIQQGPSRLPTGSDRSLTFTSRGGPEEEQAVEASENVMRGIPAVGIASGSPISRVARQEAVAPGPTGTTEDLSPEEQDALSQLMGHEEQFSWSVPQSDPRVFLVSDFADRARIARELLRDPNPGEGSRANWISVVQSRAAVAGQIAVRVAAQSYLKPAVAERQRRVLEDALRADLTWVFGELAKESPSSLQLTVRALRWSQLSETTDSNGQSYFERFLNNLENRRIRREISGWIFNSRETKTALQWLLQLTGRHSEQVRKAITLRSRRDVGYQVADRATAPREGLRLGSVVGRWVSGSASVQLQAAEEMVVTPNGARDAVLRARNSPLQNDPIYGWQLVVKLEHDPFWRVYRLYIQTLGPGPVPGQANGEFFFYYPGSVLVPPLSYDPEVRREHWHQESTLDELLTESLRRGRQDRGWSLTGLDYAVLRRATLDQRLEMVRLLVNGDRARYRQGAGVIARLILSTPQDQFAAFERRLSSEGITGRLLRLRSGPAAMIGQAFTMRSVQSLAVGGRGVERAMQDLPVFRIGKVGSEVHYVLGRSQQVSSRVISLQDWGARDAPGPIQGQGPLRNTPLMEPAQPGESTRTIQRTGVVLTYGSYPDLQADSGRWQRRSERQSRPFLPTELVQVIVTRGGQSRTMLVTAFEVATLSGDPESEANSSDFWDWMETLMWARAGFSVSRALAASVTGATARRGIRAAVRRALLRATGRTGRQAARSVAHAAAFTATKAIEQNREEIARTPEGRAFLAVFDTAQIMLAAHGLSRLLASGLLGQLIRLGRRAGATLFGAGKAAVQRAVERYRLLQATLEELPRRPLGLQPAFAGAGTGPTAAALQIPDLSSGAFRQAFLRARARLTSERALQRLRGTGAGPTAQRVLGGRLPQLSNPTLPGARAFRRAWAAVARRAERMDPRHAKRFLEEVEAALAGTKGNTVGMAQALRAAARHRNPRLFLQQTRQMAAIRGLSDEAFRQLTRKAAKGATARGGLDMRWLLNTELTGAEITRIAEDPSAPWQLFKRASRAGASAADIELAHRRLRGYAGEMLARRRGFIRGYETEAVQVPAYGRQIDIAYRSTGRAASPLAAEVKTWSREMWARVLSALDQPVDLLDARVARNVNKLQQLRSQLLAARRLTGRQPVLVTSQLTPQQERRLRQFLRHGFTRSQSPISVRIARLNERSVRRVISRLAARMGIPMP